MGILIKIREFLFKELKLTLSLDKTKITNPREDHALFLGTVIKESNHKGSALGVNHQRKKTAGELRLLTPINRVFKNLADVGLMDLDKKYGLPRFLWLAYDKDTIINLYNSVLRGYLNYYSFTHNYAQLASSLEFILKNSCAKLLAAKFKLGSVSKVLSKFGDDLKGNDKVAFLKPSYKLNV